jgi:NAD(P)-dependent dehydrogenase (short-subunit alcohol dehydrogenase family)
MLREEGFQVIASARQPEDVAMLRDEGFEALQIDVSDRQSIDAGVAETLKLTNGKLYGLFNHGAYGQPGAVEDLSWDALETQLRTNLLGWHELTRQVIPVMRHQGEGRIIHNSSVLGFVAMPYRGAYNCSKFALEGLTDTLRLELHGSGVQVSLVEPGPIRSRFRDNAKKAFERFINPNGSPHEANYKAMAERLEKEGDAAPFTLDPKAVVKCVLHALTAKQAKPRYRVTFPTHLFWWLKRILSTKTMDRILRKASGDGAR